MNAQHPQPNSRCPFHRSQASPATAIPHPSVGLASPSRFPARISVDPPPPHHGRRDDATSAPASGRAAVRTDDPAFCLQRYGAGSALAQSGRRARLLRRNTACLLQPYSCRIKALRLGCAIKLPVRLHADDGTGGKEISGVEGSQASAHPKAVQDE